METRKPIMQASAFFLHHGRASSAPLVVAAVIVPVPAVLTFAPVVPVFTAVAAFFPGSVIGVVASTLDDGLQDVVAHGCRGLCSCRNGGQAAHDDE